MCPPWSELTVHLAAPAPNHRLSRSPSAHLQRRWQTQFRRFNLRGQWQFFPQKSLYVPLNSPSITCRPLRVDEKLERCPFKVLCKSRASCSHNFAANFSPQPTTAASRFGQFTQFRVDLSSLTCIWPTKATLTTRGNPFTLECISQLTKVLSVIQASRLNCTLHFLCILKVSEVPRRSLNLHFLNSPESQTITTYNLSQI